MLTLRAGRDDDPITRALRPPPDETPEEREERMRAHQSARLISREIDERLLEDKKELERKRNAIRVLLLGQAESGKSTTLRNFQLTFCPEQFHAESTVWRTVIQLNIIRSVKVIIETIQNELGNVTTTSPPTSPGPPARSPRLGPAQLANSAGSAPASPQSPSPPSQLTDAHRRLCKRLSPLLAIEQTLTRKLLSIPDFAGILHPGPDGVLQIDATTVTRHSLTVRAGSGWKRVLQSATKEQEPCNGSQPSQSSRRPGTADRNREDPTSALAACKDDIVALWSDSVLREVLKERDVRPENSSGFFLDDIDRIAVRNYEPTAEDILRARIRTLGIEEHYFAAKNNIVDRQKDWYIYDVGGSRSVRDRWPAYFDDVDAIIFLAPLVFNQFLEEASDVNRLHDSLQLWQQVCKNKLLRETALILFLNKTDVLKRTLVEGVQVKKYIPSYSNRNEFKDAFTYFRGLFTDTHNRYSPKNRTFYHHATSVINAELTRKILDEVQESIIRVNLTRVHII